MGNELKIVLIVIATYLVIGLQNLASTSVFLIPYELNPIVILSVSIYVLVKNRKQSSVYINTIYFSSVFFYSLLSSRTLHILYNRFELSAFLDISSNVWTPLIAIILFYGGLVMICLRFGSKSLMWYISLLLLVGSLVGALFNIELLQVILFTLFVLSFLILMKRDSKNEGLIIFYPVSYQLFLFILLENTYFILTNYC